jgi:NADH dehydrogenase FAD-containing subunit
MNVIIVGGGFCGALVAKYLDSSRVPTILIDKKPYFEYTPGLPKALSMPHYYKRLIVPYPHFLHSTKIITTQVEKITPSHVTIKTQKLPYSFLVISTGVDYPILLQNKRDVYTLQQIRNSKNLLKKVDLAKHVLVIGGGLVGVEVAAELKTAFPKIQVAVVHAHDRLLERNSEKASKIAHDFLLKYGTHILYNQKIVKHKKCLFITNTGIKIKADIGIWCAGLQSSPYFMIDFPSSIYGKKRYLHVDNQLHLKGFTNIFVGGDIAHINEEKTAQNAERHAKIISQNILRSINHKKLVTYTSRKGPLILSLGQQKAMIDIQNLVIQGKIIAILKKLVEKRILFSYRH